MSKIAIIPSAGSGSRFNSPIPKQYVKVLGKELIVHTISVFQNSNEIDEIIIPADTNYFDLLNKLKNKYNLNKITKIIEGGKERQDSVYNGLKAKIFNDNDLILVHDAARPLLSQDLLKASLKEAEKFDSVVVAIKARDTLISGNEFVEKYEDRSKIFYAQTPQIFRYDILIKSFEFALKQKFIATDESMIVKNAGYKVKIVNGDITNFKITESGDLIIMEKLLNK
ncbi:MAG: 2-C-methyl-D-erythritol 4-phosphate cytidylyltransferase [Ignavibacteriales bacterium]|nr:2-C-methyl-D-erythritol 4-phosphate cytidylyltransferase [Ignavibacteriales bacterium]